jgi:hypothetical protein
MFCVSCGKPASPGDKFCAHCGSPVRQESVSASAKVTPLTAAPARPPQSKIVTIVTMMSMLVGLGGYQVVGPILFPWLPGADFNIPRIVGAGVVAALFGFLGGFIGRSVDRTRR